MDTVTVAFAYTFMLQVGSEPNIPASCTGTLQTAQPRKKEKLPAKKKKWIIFGAFAKLRKGTISFVMSVRPSAWNNSRLPLDEFSLNLIFEDFFFENMSGGGGIKVSSKSQKNRIIF